MTPDPAWARVLRALAALTVDVGLKGVTFRVRAGPVREALEREIATLPGPLRRIHTALAETELFGGLDVAASPTAGRAVHTAGIAASPALLVLPMAERTPPGLAARLGQLLDTDAGHRLILLDEGAEADERAPACLRERLAFGVDLTDLGHKGCAEGRLGETRADLRAVRLAPETAAQIAQLAAAFGIDSLRPPLHALRAARALAALAGRQTIEAEDLSAAAELVFPDRATRLPDEAAPNQAPEPPPEANDDEVQDAGDGLPDALMVEAVRACLPSGLLTRLESGEMRAHAGGSGAGAVRTGNRRGRPLPARRGRPDGRARVDLLATLRAAAPWQTIRKRAAPDAANLIVRMEDIRLRRYEDRSDRLLVFLVDASGSAAMARLAEAKGAVELLLAQAYARRDHVALIAMRGAGAELLLPPTRSLVQAKKRLSALPGGGGTPLAAGLKECLSITSQARRRGLSPALVLLTDCKANIALDGTGNRERATEDAHHIARLHATERLPALLIDIAPRSGPEAARLARSLRGHHVPLPFADAAGISRAVATTLQA